MFCFQQVLLPNILKINKKIITLQLLPGFGSSEEAAQSRSVLGGIKIWGEKNIQ